MNRAPRNRRNAAGFTTIELMIAGTISLIVVLAAGVIVLQSSRSFRFGNDKVIMQGEATRSVEQIARDVRRARWIDFVASDHVVLYDTFHTQFAEYDRAASRARRNGSPLSDYVCTDLEFAVNADTTTVDITLELQSEAQDLVKVESKASIRNRSFVLNDPSNP